jgi:hypothetical protein
VSPTGTNRTNKGLHIKVQKVYNLCLFCLSLWGSYTALNTSCTLMWSPLFVLFVPVGLIYGFGYLLYFNVKSFVCSSIYGFWLPLLKQLKNGLLLLRYLHVPD